MLARFSAYIFCLGLTTIVGLKRCPSLNAPLRGNVACFRGNDSVSCTTASIAVSRAEFKCLQFYKLSAGERRVIRCRSNGTWSLPPPKCVPDCGRRSGAVSLVVSGALAPRGAYPWHVAVYHLAEGVYEYWCGGSLVSETVVMTAAHCVWEVAPERLMLAFGKFHREYGVVERGVQKIRASRVVMPESYQDVGGNYNGDIAVVVLERAVMVGHYVAPVCVDWGQRLMERQVVGGSSGVVVGWGLTENGTLSDGLRVVRLGVVSAEKCIAEQERDFKKFVTYTSFCAGWGNESGVCNGDSGGGMTFFDEESGRWYLQGLVSVSPRRRGTPFCDPHFHTVFTKVGMFSNWLRRMADLKAQRTAHDGIPEDDEDNHSKRPIGRRPIHFLHTTKMLQLAALSASPDHSPPALA